MDGGTLLESLVQRIYQAAVDGVGWVTFLSFFASAIGSTHPSLYIADTSGQEGSVEISVGLDDMHRRTYREYYIHRNVWIQGARTLLKPGSIRSSDQVCSQRDFLRSEWYADFCRPLGWMRGIGATILQDGTTTVNLGAFRGVNHLEYGEKEFSLIRALMPHLQRGLMLYRHLAESRAHCQSLEAILHALATPSLLVDRDGTVLYMNVAAERLIQTSDGLVVADGHVCALLPAEATSLRALIAGACDTSGCTGCHSGGTLSISRPSGQEALEILITPLPAEQGDWIVRRHAVAALFVTERSRMPLAEAPELSHRYSLTVSEAKVAVAVSRGLAGKEICRELDISYNTLKSHLKHIYAKTHTTHQSDLVRLVSGGAHPLLRKA